MTLKQQQLTDLLNDYITANRLQILEEKTIDYGHQFRISDGKEICVVNIFSSGSITVSGKPSPFREKTKEWANFQRSILGKSGKDNTSTSATPSPNHGTKYVVSAEKWDKIRAAIGEMDAQIAWQDHRAAHEVYHADIRSGADRVVVTQFQSGTLFVQGRNSDLFHEICRRLDAMLAQSPAEHATRYLSEDQATQLKPQMERPEAEAEAWQWLEVEFQGRDILDFVLEHDRNTLVAGAVLLGTAETLKMPDYSPLVMPFARAYEGFLIQLFITIGLVDRGRLESEDIEIIKIGGWLDKLPSMLKNPRRDGHIVPDLQTAWEGTRHLMIHSDPARQMTISNYEKAKQEICGVLIRAMIRGHGAFVKGEIPLKLSESTGATESVSFETQKKSSQGKGKEKEAVQLLVADEVELVKRLRANGYQLKYSENSNDPTKWRTLTGSVSLSFAREPGNVLEVRGKEREQFVEWYQRESTLGVSQPGQPAASGITSHIGADEAGKGDYFGPLVVAAVYVDESAEFDLIRWGIRDSKSLSDSTIAELAERIRGRCLYTIESLAPPEYNAAYREHQNLNRLLAAAHAKAIQRLIEETGCRVVLVDQFTSPGVLEDALDVQKHAIQLSQQIQGEADTAVAAASILARAEFVEAIEKFRLKSGLEIPLGASAPEIVSVGREIVHKWGQPALERIAKVNFKTTKEILRDE